MAKFDYKQIPYVAKIGITILVVLLVAGSAYFFGLAPIAKANQADALVLKGKESEIAQLTPYKAKLADLIKQDDLLKAQMEDQRKVVPEEKDVPSFITTIANEALNSGVEVRRYTPKETTTKEYYIEVPFEIDVDGPYYAVLNFYDHMQKLPRIVNVNRLAMSSLKGGKIPTKRAYKWASNETVAAASILTTFYANVKPAPAPAAVKK
jgi:type IV pilus assembly protein PilO